jgi:hypothetical protein
MAGLRALFDASSTNDAIIPNSPAWHTFTANVRSHGLCSPLFERVLSTAALQGGPLPPHMVRVH